MISTLAGTGTYLYNGDGIAADTANFTAYTIALDDSSGLCIADIGNQRVRIIDSSGIIHTVAGNGIIGFLGDGGLAVSAEIHNPEGIAFDHCGNLYIADDANNRIRKVTFDSTCSYGSDTTHTDTTNAVQNIQRGGFSVYPNPANLTLTLSINGEGTITSVAIINMLGQAVYNKAFVPQKKITIDISALPDGLYFIKVNGVYMEKVVKE